MNRCYDPSTGEVVKDIQEFSVKAGILSRSRTEEGGIGEEYTLDHVDSAQQQRYAAPAQN